MGSMMDDDYYFSRYVALPCPECLGAGHVIVTNVHYNEDGKCEIVKLDLRCDTCSGTGEVTQEQYAQKTLIPKN